jgi:hypothetical protein
MELVEQQAKGADMSPSAHRWQSRIGQLAHEQIPGAAG